MTKSEFLDTLRMQLQGTLSPAQIEGHLHYYSEYISQEVACGKTESQVLEELGSPVLIARTLLDAAQAASYDQTRRDDAGGYDEGAREEYDDEYGDERIHTWNVNPLVIKWGIPIALFLILFALLLLLGSVVTFAARFFVPIVIILVVLKLIRKR